MIRHQTAVDVWPRAGKPSRFVISASSKTESGRVHVRRKSVGIECRSGLKSGSRGTEPSATITEKRSFGHFDRN